MCAPVPSICGILAQELATFVWALAQLAERQYGQSGVDSAAPAFFSACLPILRHYNAQVRLQRRRCRQLPMHAPFHAACGACVRALQDLVTTLWGLSRMGWPAPALWVQAMHEHAFSLLPYVEAHQYASMMCSLVWMDAWPSQVGSSCWSWEVERTASCISSATC